jgi:hypothetical protein
MFPEKKAEVAVSRKDLVTIPEIQRDEIGVMPIWLGKRPHDDLERFNSYLELYREFGLYPSFEIPDAGEAEYQAQPALAFAQVDLDLRRVLSSIKDPLAIFIITTAGISEYSWLTHLYESLQKFRKPQGKGQTPFVYKVILGSGFLQEGPKDPEGHFSKNEMRAHQLGGVYLPYHPDWPSVGIRRLIEFMNRIMGYDLPGEKFPNYTGEEIAKIGWNINREDFNSWSKREGAIPKYEIVNGKPRFPF